MMAYQCDNEALDDIKQYGMVDTTHAASDGCKRQVSKEDHRHFHILGVLIYDVHKYLILPFL